MTGEEYAADLQRLAVRDLPAITDTCLRARLRRGWPPRQALTVPQGEWHARRAREVRRRERAVLQVLVDAGGPLIRAEVARRAGVNRHQAWRALDALRQAGLVDRSLAACNSRWWATRRD
jgi:hypothetical protein